MPLANCLCIAQAKGGVGKTTIAANLAGEWAHSGRRVLLVDFDPQGNCALDLGYEPDSGAALFKALVVNDMPAPVLREVRPRLDVIPAGTELGKFAAVMQQEPSVITAMGAALERVIRSCTDIDAPYDLIVIDTPPGDAVAGQAAMAISSHVLAPARADDASLQGTLQLGLRFSTVKTTINPSVLFAGVVLFGIGVGATRMEARIRSEMQEMIGDAAPVLLTRIREANAAAVYARRKGRLAREIAQDVAAAADDRFAALREGRRTAEALPSNAEALAEDFAALADELYVNMAQRRAA